MGGRIRAQRASHDTSTMVSTGGAASTVSTEEGPWRRGVDRRSSWGAASAASPRPSASSPTAGRSPSWRPAPRLAAAPRASRRAATPSILARRSSPCPGSLKRSTPQLARRCRITSRCANCSLATASSGRAKIATLTLVAIASSCSPRCASSQTMTPISSRRSWLHPVRSIARGFSSPVARTS